MIYLDYQATTPVAPEVAKAMQPWIEEKFANPHSPSRWGREADAAIEVARNQVLQAIGRDGGSLAFTGSATEAINWAIKGTIEKATTKRNRVVTVETEHAAVLDTCEWLETLGYGVVRLPVGHDGLLDLDRVGAALDDTVALVAVMLVNNEIGVIQPVGEIAALAHDVGAVMLCDAVQGLGRIEIPEGPDLVAVSAHKIHGPKGIGALWIRQGADPTALVHGGGQEMGIRSGTLSPMLCVGFGAAAKLASERREEDHDHVEDLWITAGSSLMTDWIINGSVTQRYHGNLNMRWPGLDASRLIAEIRDVAFSLGSACASGSGRPSHVLRAIGLNDREARSSVRLGFGRYTTKEEVIDAVNRIDATARLQQGWAA